MRLETSIIFFDFLKGEDREEMMCMQIIRKKTNHSMTRFKGNNSREHILLKLTLHKIVHIEVNTS